MSGTIEFGAIHIYFSQVKNSKACVLLFFIDKWKNSLKLYKL